MSVRRLIAGIAVALFCSAAAAAFAATPYHLTDLGTFGRVPVLTPMSVNKVNGSIEIVGIARRAAIWIRLLGIGPRRAGWLICKPS